MEQAARATDRADGLPQHRHRVAVVTGSSAGIGMATARRLLTAGDDVVINGRDGQRLLSAARALREDARANGSPGCVVPVAGDAGDPGTIDRIMSAAVQIGGPDIVVANAGGGTASSAAAVDSDRLGFGGHRERRRCASDPNACRDE